MQPWWQKKIIVGAGMVGSALLLLQSILGTIVWPTYKIGPYPLAMLTATGTPYEYVFKTLQFIADGLILMTMVALIKYAIATKKDDFNRDMRVLALVWVVWLAFQFVWSISLDVAITVTPISFHDIISGLIILGLAYAMIRLGQSARKNGFESLRNALTLLAILYVLFHILMFIVERVGWPINGFLDVIANDILAVAMGFLSWYFMRLTEA